MLSRALVQPPREPALVLMAPTPARALPHARHGIPAPVGVVFSLPWLWLVRRRVG